MKLSKAEENALHNLYCKLWKEVEPACYGDSPEPTIEAKHMDSAQNKIAGLCRDMYHAGIIDLKAWQRITDISKVVNSRLTS